MSWSWKHLLGLRDKIKEFVNVKIGNGKTCSIWFDKWNSRGPLSKLIDHRMIGLVGLDINAKVIDLVDNNSWSWPIDWVGRYDEVLNVPVLVLNNELKDRTYWCNKKGKEKQFSVSEVWKAIKHDYPKISCEDESHSHMFFACRYSKRLWERLKPMAMFDSLVVGAVIYFLWKERNNRIMEHKERPTDTLGNLVIKIVRFRLMGLTLKCTPDVIKAAKIWNIPFIKDKLARSSDRFGFPCVMLGEYLKEQSTKYWHKDVPTRTFSFRGGFHLEWMVAKKVRFYMYYELPVYYGMQCMVMVHSTLIGLKLGICPMPMHRYVVSSLMDTVYRMSERFLQISSF
ncbi:hypothetical protein Tco_0601743 [Tanacetum coccineum]